MSRQGKLKLTHSALKERWPTEQKQEMPTEVEPMEETRILMKIEWNYSAK